MEIRIIAAIGDKGLLGLEKDGVHSLPWYIPEDMRHFSHTTTGHAVIMGRTTWESIPDGYRPLPNRINLVLSRDEDYEAEGATVFTSLEDACAFAEEHTESAVYVIGGAGVYAQALPLADTLLLTRVEEDSLPPFPAGTNRILFPEYEDRFMLSKAESYQQSSRGPTFRFETWKKKN